MALNQQLLETAKATKTYDQEGRRDLIKGSLLLNSHH